ncbi:hypothetical protein Bbelb_142520 [Branchiostoma belcheri]|nr:hypothetical protein Bbelb_142520 [Branchiostoma belcheri]
MAHYLLPLGLPRGGPPTLGVLSAPFPLPHPLGMDGVRLNSKHLAIKGVAVQTPPVRKRCCTAKDYPVLKTSVSRPNADVGPPEASGGMMAWAVFLLTASALLAITSVSAQDANPTDSVGSKTVIVGGVESDVYLKKNEDGSYEGFDQDVLDELSKLTGLNFRIKSPADGRYGMKVDGVWTGMMSQLINKEIDMAMGLFITMEREKYVDFSKPLLEEHLEILVKKPEYQGQPPVGLPVPEVMLQYQGQPP